MEDGGKAYMDEMIKSNYRLLTLQLEVTCPFSANTVTRLATHLRRFGGTLNLRIENMNVCQEVWKAVARLPLSLLLVSPAHECDYTFLRFIPNETSLRKLVVKDKSSLPVHEMISVKREAFCRVLNGFPLSKLSFGFDGRRVTGVIGKEHIAEILSS